MNAILGFTEILTDMSEDPKQTEFLKIISNSGESLLGLINDILDLSKIEAGKLIVNNKAISLKSLLEEIKTLFSHKCQSKGLDLIIENEGVDMVYMDGLRMKQILLNVVGNAVKFTSDGFIKVNIKKTEATEPQDTTSNIIISVTDTGIGIPQKQLDYIFEAFTQATNINNVAHGGTGLGLAITKRLTEIMNGQVECQSSESKGTTFTLTFNNVKVLQKPNN